MEVQEPIDFQEVDRRLKAEEFAEAEAICRRLLAEHPDDARVLRALAVIMERQEKSHEAMGFAIRAGNVDPKNPDGWHLLGEISFGALDYFNSAHYWSKVVELVPDNHYPLTSLGLCAHYLGRLAEAEGYYRAALALKPDHGPALNSLARLQIDRGEMTEAEQTVRTALKFDPLDQGAIGLLLQIRGKKSTLEDIAIAERFLKDPNPDPMQRGHVLLALARLYDSRAEYPRAAELARQGNAARRSAMIGKKGDKEGDSLDRLVDFSIKYLDEKFFNRLRGAGNPSLRPIFIFGMPRSGTSLAEQILASHSKVYGAGELQLGAQLRVAIEDTIGILDNSPHSADKIDSVLINDWAEQFLEILGKLDGGVCPRIIDKNPGNSHHLGLLSLIFPNATFIHCRRDLRDVAVSLWMLDLNTMSWPDDVSLLARHIRGYVRIMDHWQKVLPVRIHEVDYQAMVSDTETHARRLVAACGLEWEDACLKFHETKRPVRTASFAQVRQPVYQKSVARWKHYEHELADLFSQLPPQP